MPPHLTYLSIGNCCQGVGVLVHGEGAPVLAVREDVGYLQGVASRMKVKRRVNLGMACPCGEGRYWGPAGFVGAKLLRPRVGKYLV
eukprot:1157266-Pelagomonas_calceolata.AAC.10